MSTYEVCVWVNPELESKLWNACHSWVLNETWGIWFGHYRMHESWAMFMCPCLEEYWTIYSNDEKLLGYLISDFGLKVTRKNISPAKSLHVSGDRYLSGDYRRKEDM